MKNKNHAQCSGCSLCLLACPVWHQTGDIRLTPHGRAKALQHGARVDELGAAVDACTLCGACEPACPERLPLVDMILALRAQRPAAASVQFVDVKEPAAGTLLLAGTALRRDAERLRRVAGMLDATIASDDGSDIAEAIERGLPVPAARLRSFHENLRKAGRLIVAEGLLLRKIREWLPRVRAISLGKALSAQDAVRAKLRASDLYVIEARAFHADHARLVRHYDALRRQDGFATNLDLQRLAIPTCTASVSKAVDSTAQARWILDGRAHERVVVEDPADREAFAAATDRPVVHLGDL